MFDEEKAKLISLEIRRLYPQIPEGKADLIAWTMPVCRNGKMQMSERVRRAVRAYIRHELTEYDDFADRKGWQYARELVREEVWEIEKRLKQKVSD